MNNAGINIRGPIEELSPEQFREVQDTNLTSMWLVCRAAAGHLKEQGYGRVTDGAVRCRRGSGARGSATCANVRDAPT